MNDKRYILFAFNGDPMCFIHVMLTAFDMEKRGFDVRVVIEGSATRLIKDLEDGSPLTELYHRFRKSGLIGCVCKACAKKMGAQDAAVRQGLVLSGEMNGHPSMARYIDEGYQIITF